MFTGIRRLTLGIVLGSAAIVHAQAPEVRGTWLTTTANDAIASPEQTAATMKKLRGIGLNTVYVECWKNGYTEFPSDVMGKATGVKSKVNAAPTNLQRDLLLEAEIEGHRNGLLVVAWMEYGFIAAHKDTQNELRALGEREGFLLQDASGNVVGKQNGFVWMNPLHPKAQEIVLGIAREIAQKYDVDGIQLDDRIAMPTEMGYDPYTRELYAKEHDGKAPPADPKDAEWVQWRADKVTAFARRFASEVHKVNPKLIVSLSPAPYPWSKENYACDWPAWTKWEGAERWDEIIPQNYRLDFEKTKASVAEGIPQVGERKGDLLAGVRLVGDGPDLPVGDAGKMISYAREAGLGGQVWWFSKGVLGSFEGELKSVYGGAVPSPRVPVGWRAAPVKSMGADGEFRVSVPEEGKWRVLAKVSGQWVERESKMFKAGTRDLSDPMAEELELLRDRRP